MISRSITRSITIHTIPIYAGLSSGYCRGTQEVDDVHINYILLQLCMYYDRHAKGITSF